jgi:hypothetical protein
MEKIKHKDIESIEVERHLNFNRIKATLLMDVVPENSSFESLRKFAEKEGLSQKKEFHITIIGSETGAVIIEKISSMLPEERDEFLTRIENFSKRFTWCHFFLPEYYLISKEYGEGGSEVVETRKSVIQNLKLPDLEKFYENLNELLEIKFSTPFPHVTLFTTSTNEEKKLRGIGIYSKEQLKTLNPIKIDVDQDLSYEE